MKIIITSDTHNCPGLTNLSTIKEMSQEIAAQNPDIVVHGGDVGEVRLDIKFFKEVLKTLKPDAMILGNHDLWVDPKKLGPSSLQLWEKVLPNIIKKAGIHYLERDYFTKYSDNYGIKIKSGVAIVGSYLHYDYSSQDPEGSAVNFVRNAFPDWTMNEYYERFKKRVNNDGHYLIGLPSDRDFSEQIRERFRTLLHLAEIDRTVGSIIIVTHVPCMPSLITRKPYDLEWSKGTPYFGNLSHVEFIKQQSKVKAIVCGHSHQGIESTEIFQDGREVPVYCLASDYGDPRFITIEI